MDLSPENRALLESVSPAFAGITTQRVELSPEELGRLLDAARKEGVVCPTCRGAKRLHVVEGACTPAHDMDCPTCVGIPGAPGLVMTATVPR